MRCPACRRDEELVTWTSAGGLITGEMCPECLSLVCALAVEAHARQLAEDELEAIKRENNEGTLDQRRVWKQRTMDRRNREAS